MASIEFGVAIPAAKGIPQFARRAEQLGFDYLCSGEHMMFHGPVTNTLIVLSTAAGATEKIKLMSTVVLLPLYRPMVIAKLTSVLDVASNGRYHMGVGIGGEFPKEFEACGVPVKQRGSRTNEALEIIKKLWTEKNVSFDGRYNKFSGVTMEPAPIQKPHPPIWVAGRKEPAMQRAATYADGWIPYM
ncbi:MAG: LLM class flavin-dependent oxidoreductase, partial [Candidatus Binataceae bacterium]